MIISSADFFIDPSCPIIDFTLSFASSISPLMTLMLIAFLALPLDGSVSLSISLFLESI